MKDFPLVSIFIPIYNTGFYVVQALATVKQQSYPNIECYVVDDASVDNSKAIVKSWLDENNFECHFVEHEINKGLTQSLNEFLVWAKGEFFTFIGDDLWVDDKLYRQVLAFQEAGSDCALVYGDMMLIDEDNRLISESYFKKKGWNETVEMPSGRVSIMTYLEKAFIPAPSVMLRTDYVRSVGGYDDSLYTEDVDMWAKLLSRYEVRYVPETLVKYRIRQNSMSNDRKNVWKVHQTHLYIWPKYLDAVHGADRDKLLNKIFNDIIRYYKATGDKELCLKVIHKMKVYSRAMVWIKLIIYIRLGLPKKLVGHFVSWK